MDLIRKTGKKTGRRGLIWGSEDGDGRRKAQRQEQVASGSEQPRGAGQQRSRRHRVQERLADAADRMPRAPGSGAGSGFRGKARLRPAGPLGGRDTHWQGAPGTLGKRC